MAVNTAVLAEINRRLLVENERLRREVANLKAQNEEIAFDGVQLRHCMNCKKNLPDGPLFFPGYLERADDPVADAMRYVCAYCR
jgi:hypothetical protein